MIIVIVFIKLSFVKLPEASPWDETYSVYICHEYIHLIYLMWCKNETQYIEYT